MTASSEPSLIGRRVFGGYQITGLLGEGGMGAVYVAEHRGLAKKIAIKVLHEAMTTNRDIVSRFLAEARAASALDHPNIIDVIDSSTFDDGQLYIALEHIDGVTLSAYCRDVGVVPIDAALRILAQVCCGLEAAHYRGIVHRDLKPGNIMLIATELNPLFVKVLDFGIAKLSDPGLAGGVATRTNAIAGTPQYMAPEQARGLKDADHRADIYALGVIAYRMMTGRLPFGGDSLGEIVYQQAMTAPTPAIGLRPDLPLGWSEAIGRALLAAPNNRQTSARELALELANATPGGLDIVREVAPLFFSKTWVSRTRKLSIDPAHAHTATPFGVSTPPAASPAAPTAQAQPQSPSYPTAELAPAPAGGTASYPVAPGAHAAEKPTTLSSAAGAAIAPVAPAQGSNRRAALIGIAVVAILGTLGGATALVVSSTSADDPEEIPDAASSLSPDASPEVTTTQSPADAAALDAPFDAAPKKSTRDKKRDRKSKSGPIDNPPKDKKTDPPKDTTKPPPDKKKFDPNAPLGGT